jgi:8-oxo-dGTP diphosphatase
MTDAPTPPPPGPVQVAAGVLWVDDRLLVGRRSAGGRHPGKWELPGGKLERGEDPRAALARELREELDVEAVIGDALHVTTHRYPDGHRVQLTFLEVRSVDREPINRVFSELRWVPVAELEALDFLAADRDFIATLAARAIVPRSTHRPPAGPADPPSG